jgi:hypothetical protein
MLPLADSRDGTVDLVLDPPTAGCATSPRTSHASCDFVERVGA